MTELEDPSKAPENPSEPLENPKALAKRLLAEGSSVDEVLAETNLSRPVVLGLLGVLRKAEKKLEKAEGEPSENLGAIQEEETLVRDLRDEAKLDGAALIAARNRNRLKREGPEIYGQLHGGSEANSPGKVLADLELAKYIRTMREEETAVHRNNGDSSSQTELQRQINELKEELHKKDLEALQKQSDKLESEVRELREDMRHSTNSGSDLAVVVRETSNLIGKALESPGVLRNYLLPDGTVNIGKRADAPLLLHTQAVGNGVIQELQKHGLTTRILPRSDLK